jgi:hypothetical protein
MIISNKHKYLFVELGRTGTSSVSNALIEKCDGISILHKHSTLTKLLTLLNKKETNYFIFATVRNPLDKVLSTYFKLQSYWTWEEIKKRKFITRIYLTRRKRDLEKNEYSFEKYFLKFYKLPYVEVSQSEKEKYDYIMHFENLQNDFDQVLSQLNIDKKISLPKKNPTINKTNSNFYEFFDSPKLRRRAKWVFGLYFEEFNYKFPLSWGQVKNTFLNKSIKKIKLFLYYFYWQYLWKENQFTREIINNCKKNVGKDF